MNVKEIVVNKILEKLEEGTIPWSKPWLGQTINYVTRKPYTGVNTLLLDRAGEYLTFNQIKKLNGKIKKGSKSNLIVFYKVLEDEEKEKTFGMLRYYKVFHLDDVEGIESKLETNTNTDDKLENCEKVVEKYKDAPQIKNIRGDDAYYKPSTDEVVLPKKEQFKSIEQYYGVMFHELAHSTGHEKRLNRLTKDARFGNTEYSKEELVAEITTTMICSTVGIENKTINNSVAYIKSWMEVIKADTNLIIQSANQAQKAYEYIVDVK
jgi:antirestriction protein ArdC